MASNSVTQAITAESREKRINDIKSWLTGGESWELFSEEFVTTLSMDELKDLMDVAAEAVASKPASAVARTNYAYAASLYRDAVYSHANRGYILRLGAHNKFREAYEGGKSYIDCTLG